MGRRHVNARCAVRTGGGCGGRQAEPRAVGSCGQGLQVGGACAYAVCVSWHVMHVCARGCSRSAVGVPCPPLTLASQHPGNGIGAEGAAGLGDALKCCPQLQSLDLSSTSVRWSVGRWGSVRVVG
jgi:hypothetical protein